MTDPDGSVLSEYTPIYLFEKAYSFDNSEPE